MGGRRGRCALGRVDVGRGDRRNDGDGDVTVVDVGSVRGDAHAGEERVRRAKMAVALAAGCGPNSSKLGPGGRAPLRRPTVRRIGMPPHVLVRKAPESSARVSASGMTGGWIGS